MQKSVEEAESQGGSVLCGGLRQNVQDHQDGYYAQPAIIDMKEQSDVVRQETFAPILYILSY